MSDDPLKSFLEKNDTKKWQTPHHELAQITERIHRKEKSQFLWVSVLVPLLAFIIYWNLPQQKSTVFDEEVAVYIIGADYWVDDSHHFETLLLED